MSKRIPITIALMLVILFVWISITPIRFIRNITERLNQIGYDLQLRSQLYTLKLQPSGSVVIVDIDDKSLKAEGRWPWPRSKMALLVDKLQSKGAAVIAFDIFFPEKELGVDERLEQILTKNNIVLPLMEELKQYAYLFDEDEALAKSLEHTTGVLSFSFLMNNEEQNTLPPPVLVLTKQQAADLAIYAVPGFISNIPILQQSEKAAGYVNVFSDDDGIVRRVPLLLNHRGNIYASLALQAYVTFLGQDIKLLTPSYYGRLFLEGIQVGSQVIPTDGHGQALIPFIGRSYTMPYYSAIDVLTDKTPPDALLGKIVFIGTSATGLGDLQPTAIQNPYPGVEIQASLVDGMIKNQFSYAPGWADGFSLTLIVLLGLSATFIFSRLGPKTLIVIFLFFPVLMLYLNSILWSKTGLVVSVLLPVILVLLIAMLYILFGYLFEARRREELNTMFGQYVPAEHITEMLKSDNSFALKGESREMSVLFSDICSFTTLAEKMTATELVDMLNLYFTPMTEIIYKYVGTIDKYVGDMIIAFWGAPLSDEEHAFHAIAAALEMQSRLADFRKEQTLKNLPEIRMGIGINSGTMSVGDMGSRYRRNYTVMGDSVNLASRVEGLTRYYNVDIIVTEFTQRLQPHFVYRKLDLVRVKGKHEAVAIFEVIGTEDSVSPEIKHFLMKYHDALDYYFKQDWELALNMFTELFNEDQHKKIYQIYIDRINQFKSHPPATDWDGVFEHKEK